MQWCEVHLRVRNEFDPPLQMMDELDLMEAFCRGILDKRRIP